MGRGLKSCATSEVDTTTGVFRIVRRRDPNSGYMWRRHCRERGERGKERGRGERGRERGGGRERGETERERKQNNEHVIYRTENATVCREICTIKTTNSTRNRSRPIKPS